MCTAIQFQEFISSFSTNVNIKSLRSIQSTKILPIGQTELIPAELYALVFLLGKVFTKKKKQPSVKLFLQINLFYRHLQLKSVLMENSQTSSGLNSLTAARSVKEVANLKIRSHSQSVCSLYGVPTESNSKTRYN